MRSCQKGLRTRLLDFDSSSGFRELLLDGLGFFLRHMTKVRLMFRVAKLGKKLMAKEPVRCARKIFGVDWKVPLIAEPKAGFRFGCILKEFDTRYKNTAEFLNAWCAATKKQQDELQKEMKDKVA